MAKTKRRKIKPRSIRVETARLMKLKIGEYKRVSIYDENDGSTILELRREANIVMFLAPATGYLRVGRMSVKQFSQAMKDFID